MRVPKTTADGLPPRGEDTVGGVEPKSAEFDAVLAEKKAKRPGAGGSERGRTEGGHATGRPGPGSSSEGGVRGGRRATPERDGGPASRDLAGAGAERTAEPRVDTREIPAREAAAREALRGADPESRRAALRDVVPGDLVAPHHTRWEPAGSAGVDSAPAADAVRSADATARVERIAEQIVRAAEVRLHADGAVEARLQLDLGRLGRMDVALERTAEGRIRVTLAPKGAEAGSLLRSRGQELAQRLEARGLKLQELTVESSGETVLRVEGTTVDTPETTRAQARAGETAAQQPERYDEEREHRGRREPESEGDEEDESRRS